MAAHLPYKMWRGAGPGAGVFQALGAPCRQSSGVGAAGLKYPVRTVAQVENSAWHSGAAGSQASGPYLGVERSMCVKRV